MFNRANKMTALLVAAAAVVSLVPATGVNAADVKRISSEDGTVYKAVAYKDGNFYIDGELEDKDEAAYYLSNGKYSDLESVDSNSEVSIYGDKYVNIENGDYFVDLTNGKVTDEDIREDNKDDAETALRKKVKDKADDRYSDHDSTKTLTEIANNNFGETWYETTYTSDGDTNGKTGSTLNVYTDEKGNYIDADYNLGKVKVEVTTASGVKITDGSVTLENTDSKKKVGELVSDKSKKVEVSSSVDKAVVIGQDSKNIYRLVEVSVKVNNDNGVQISKIDGRDVSATEVFTSVANGYSFKAIQKISKDQSSDTVDGAKYAKTAATYIMCNDEGEVPSGKDIEDFNDLVKYDTTGTEGKVDAKFTIVNGKVIAYSQSADNKVSVQVVNLKTKTGIYYLDAEGLSKDEDVDYSSDAKKSALDVDVDGNIWKIDSGFVYKFDNTDDWDKVYKVDGSMDQLSVYNKDNMVVWNEGDEVYSVIGQKEDKEDEKPEVEVKAGWNQAADGTWTFVKDGVKATGWLQDGANWYLLNDAGIMQTGWQTVGGTWYYLAENGAMQTGWQNLGGNWYFLQPSGAMVTGWYNDNGTWYFCDGSGKMLANTTVNGYVLGANGAWVK
ncbi:N-acetylmuramoyl-L-alanine amidase family protein [Clostridium sp. ZS1]|uniref:N-acetylmuramoyl-L-alanine amidase family protein n=1 Tax=Clostridium sp. ZS1 TaxID=2949989 RepID=UPI0020792AF4|nr:N-acetylmuramoyl-L-alanine amidase family protein [Clostridium sp. ZS1]